MTFIDARSDAERLQMLDEAAEMFRAGGLEIRCSAHCSRYQLCQQHQSLAGPALKRLAGPVASWRSGLPVLGSELEGWREAPA